MKETRNKKRDLKDVFQISFIVSLLSFLPYSAQAADSLADWAANISQPEVQYKILNGIFPDKIGSAASAVKDPNGGPAFFTKGTFWVRIGADIAFSTAPVPSLAVSCAMHRKPTQPPVNTTSYLFTDPVQRAVPISAGYAQDERVERVVLPKLGKSFLLLIDSSSDGGQPAQWSAAVLELRALGPNDRPKAVWTSPLSPQHIQLGFDPLGGSAERLVVKSTLRSGEIQYRAYRWNGERFEQDGFASERLMAALPPDTWRYGAPQ